MKYGSEFYITDKGKDYLETLESKILDVSGDKTVIYDIAGYNILVEAISNGYISLDWAEEEFGKVGFNEVLSLRSRGYLEETESTKENWDKFNLFIKDRHK